MKGPLLLIFFVGLAAAEHAWRPGKLYTYHLRGRTLTGLHQVEDQYSGVLLRAKLTVNPDNDHQLTLHVKNAEYAHLNQHLSNGWASEVPDEEVEYRPLDLHNTPFQLNMKNGVVDTMVVHKNIPLWQVNFFKAIASQFQVDTQAENLKRSKHNDIPKGDQQNGVFKTKEDSVNGIYETLYEIYPMPEYIIQSRPELVPLPHLQGQGRVYNIEKTRNFSNSDNHLVYRFGMSGHEGWDEGTNKMGNFLARTSGSRIVITGNLNNYTIQYSETTEKVLVAPHLTNDQKGIAVSQITASLESVGSSQSHSEPISNGRTFQNLVYEYEHGSMQSQAFGQDSSSSSSSSSSSTSASASSSSSSSETREESAVGIKNPPSKRSNRQSDPWFVKSSTESKDSQGMRMKRSHTSSQSGSSGSSSSSSEQSSLSSSDEFLPPQPQINEWPKMEFLPDNHRSPGSQGEKVVDNIVSKARLIGQSLVNPGNALDEGVVTSFSVLSTLVNGASSKQLQDAQEQLYYQESDGENPQARQSWYAFRDALASGGTGPALVTLNNIIKSNKISGMEAAKLIEAIPASARYPTTEYMNYFFEMVKSKEFENQSYLNHSAIMSFTELVRRSQVDSHSSRHRYSIRLSGPQSASHRAAVTEKYIPYFQKKLTTAVSQGDSIKAQVYIRALGNMAHPQILAVFEPYLEGRYPVSNFQRLLIVASLDEMTRLHPNTVRSVVYRIYQNQAEAPELRVAAVWQLMKTNPPAQMLQRMAEQTNYDQSKHVNGAVKSAIESAANGELRANPEMVHNARSAANFLTPESFSVDYCKNFIRSYIANEYSSEYHRQDLAYIRGLDGDYPSSLIYTLFSKMGGYVKDPETMSFMSSSSKDLVDLIYQQLQQGGRSKRESEGHQGSFTYQRIFDILKVQPEVRKQLEGHLMFSFQGTKQFFPFDNHTIEHLPKLLRQISQHLKSGVSYNSTNFHKSEVVEIGFPMAMGLQFAYSYDLTSFQHMKVKGKGHMEMQSPKSNRLPFNVGLSGQKHFVHASQRRGEIGFVFNQQRYLTMFKGISQINLPFEGMIQFNGSSNHFQASLKPSYDNEDSEDLIKLLQHKTMVFTTRQHVNDITNYFQGPNVKNIQSKSSRTYQEMVGKKETGHAFQVEVQTPKSFEELYNNLISINYLPSDPLAFMSHVDDSVDSTYYAISYNPQKSSRRPAVITVSFNNTEGKQPERRSPKSSGFFMGLPKWGLLEKSSNLAQPSRLESRVEDIANNVVSGVQDGRASVFDASISFGEGGNGWYSLTAAYAQSPVSQQSRYLAYYKGVPVESSQNSDNQEAAVEVNVKNSFISVTNYQDAINSNPTSTVDGKINFGEDDSSMVSFEAKMERTEERKKYVVRQPLSALCVQQMKENNYLQYACQNATLAAGYLDKYELTVKYRHVPERFGRASYYLYGLGRQMAYQYGRETVVDVRNQPEQLNINLKLTEDLKYLNASFKTPDFEATYENLEVNDWLMPFIVRHPQYHPYHQLSHQYFYRHAQGICTMDASNVTTFNNKTYSINLGNCYHVLAMYTPQVNYENRRASQDFSGNQDYNTKYFAVLAKETDTNSRELKVIFGDEIITLTYSGGSPSVNSNGRDISISEENIVRWKRGTQEIEAFVLPGNKHVIVQFVNQSIHITYDGKRAMIFMPYSYKNSLRGLCGTFDGEAVDDFMTPRNCIMKNHTLFAASYAVADSSCQGPALQLRHQAESAPCYAKRYIFGDVVSEVEAGRGEFRSARQSKSHKTVSVPANCNSHNVTIAEVKGKTCFSIKPQLTCNPGCKPTATLEKSIEFHCLAESSATRHWVTMVKKGANPDFSQKKSNHAMKIVLPERCVPII